MQPGLALRYNSNVKNGWTGVGWDLGLGCIQRNTKYGVGYGASDFVHMAGGSASELASRGDWGANYYGAKIEGGFSRYYYDASTGWEATSKDGMKYYYGQTPLSRQDNGYGVFKWCLDKVLDTNGNYMLVSYFKDQGEIYLERVDYAYGAGLQASNYVKFHREGRPDAQLMYTSNAPVTTAYRLKTIEVVADGQMVRAYRLAYSQSSGTSTSHLASVKQYGTDAVLDPSGTVTGGTALPLTGFTVGAEPNSFDQTGRWLDSIVTVNGQSVSTANDAGYSFFADFNGDGRADYMWRYNSNWYAALSNGSGFAAPQMWLASTVVINGQNIATSNQSNYAFVADFNGDGKADYMWRYNYNWYVAVSNGNGFNAPLMWLAQYAVVNGQNVLTSNDGGMAYMRFADFNGDGKADYMWRYNNNWYVALSSGSGFNAPEKWLAPNVVINGQSLSTTGANGWAYTVDLNGDGKADYLWRNNGWNAALSTGNGFAAAQRWLDYSVIINGQNTVTANDSGLSFMFAVDMNGDGKADYMWQNGGWNVALSTGSGFASPQRWLGTAEIIDGQSVSTMNPGGWAFVADLNGDGKADYMWQYNGIWYVTLSSGSGFVNPRSWLGATTLINGQNLSTSNENGLIYMRVADYNGDGKADYMWQNGGWNVAAASGYPAQLLTSVTNSIGSTTTFSYSPSSNYENTTLPYVVHTVSSLSMNDGFGSLSSVSYAYKYGLHDFTEREFRGFGYVKSTDPVGTTGEASFHQDGIFKGRPYEQVAKDSSGNIYSRSYNTYQSTSPYAGVNFPYLAFKADEIHDGTASYKRSETSYTYDSYGNVARKYFYGDVSITGDERDEYVEYGYDTANWIVALPNHTYVYDGGGAKKAEAWFTYDVKGNLLTETKWLNGGANPAVTYGYDAYGNRTSVTDPKGFTSTVSYDGAYHTYPAQSVNPIGHTATAVYDARFGKLTSETDPNGNTATYQYDVFGRAVKVTNPDDTASPYGTVSYYYLDIGTPGSQRVVRYSTEQSGTANVIWDETYFDGLGRTVETWREGPDGKAVVQTVYYDQRGLKESESMPYFDGLETARFTTYAYDPVGRTAQVTRPDGAYSTASYDKGRTTRIDANGHKKVEEKDVYGRLARVEEYSGAAGGYTLYAAANYEYDILGNLTRTMDAAGNQITPVYDTLGRKISMTDPDMGAWAYSYDASGNLISQTDAKGQTITFTYDALNRVTLKRYPSGTDAVYAYDETFSTNSKGRLTTLTDASGVAKYYYDKLGRITKSVKTVDGTPYTIETAYDAMGRTTSVKYPDNETVNYTYDSGGNLSQAGTYAAYSNYNALGQYGAVVFGNGASAVYQYYQSNNRLYSVTAGGPAQGLMNLTYSYDSAGNITGITDLIDAARSQTFTYDHRGRLIQAQSVGYGTLSYSYSQIGNILSKEGITYTYGAKPHAVTATSDGRVYSYDANGNMTSDGLRTISYGYDNMPSSVVMGGVATGFVYDALGGRVKKTASTYTTVYIGKLYECTGGSCSKYIFAGDVRVAQKDGAGVYYYHQDHLGSSRAVTDQGGAKVEEIQYYPYGGTRTDTGTFSASHKYTSQELDPETGLYYYGSRYYNPQLGRFISPDDIVPEPEDPQAFDRYSYVLNNPLIYTDPTGHSWLSELIGGKETLGLVMQAIGGPFFIPGTATLAQTERGRTILGIELLVGEVIVGYNYGFGSSPEMVPGQQASNTEYIYFAKNINKGFEVPDWVVYLSTLAGGAGAASDFGGGNNGNGGLVNGQGSGGVYGGGGSFLYAVSNFSAGMGDTLTFGGTRWVREQMNDAYGWGPDAVDKCSGWYQGGEWAGYAWWTAAGWEFSSGWRWQQNARGFEKAWSKNFRTGWHKLPPGNYTGAGRNLPHYHRRPGIGKHRPWQGGW